MSNSITDIVSQMKTQVSTTLDWDVVVNYNEKAINNLLKAAYDEDNDGGSKSIQNIECSLTGTDQYGDDYTINYHFDLGPPLISFTATRTSPVCNLTIPITGGTASTDVVKQTINNGVYTLKVKALELGLAKGEETSNYVSSDNQFVFPPSSEEDGVVLIDFGTSGDLAVELVIDGSDEGHCTLIDSQQGNIQEKIKNVFRTDFNDIRLVLARVNPTRPPSNAIQLVPKSFMIAAYTPTDASNEELTILSLFIQTGDHNGGTQANLNTEWSHLWNALFDCPPIPANKTASVILGKQMVFDSMIKPALNAQDLPSTLINTTGNLQVQVDTGKKIQEPEDVQEGSGAIYAITTRHTAINVTLPKLTLTLEQDSSNNHAECRGYWNFDYNFKWSIILVGVNQAGKHGSVTVTNTLDKVFSGVSLLDSYTIKTNFSIAKSDWNTDAEPDNQDFWDRFSGGVEEVPSWVNDMNVDMPTMEINLGSLNFFLTTNLLLPNREVIDIDVTEGVKIPGDFYLVGNVKEN